MRDNDSNGGLTGLAVAGSYVVLLGWDMAENDIKANSVLGFGIERRRHSDGEVIWLTGLKTFQSVDPVPDLGGFCRKVRFLGKSKNLVSGIQ